MTTGPSIPICPSCFTADEVTVAGKVDGLWEYRCDNSWHKSGPHTWVVTPTLSGGYIPAREGYLADLGVYEDLLACIEPGDGWLEYGVVEDRYRRRAPTVYASLVSSYSHSAQNEAHGGQIKNPPQRRTVSSRLAQALGQLATEGLIAKGWQKSTGYWSYNGTTSFWAPIPAPAEGNATTWEAYATANGLDPRRWLLPKVN